MRFKNNLWNKKYLHNRFSHHALRGHYPKPNKTQVIDNSHLLSTPATSYMSSKLELTLESFLKTNKNRKKYKYNQKRDKSAALILVNFATKRMLPAEPVEGEGIQYGWQSSTLDVSLSKSSSFNRWICVILVVFLCANRVASFVRASSVDFLVSLYLFFDKKLVCVCPARGYPRPRLS